jgi:RimJ/RimL family protein N-acetyltransferase
MARVLVCVKTKGEPMFAPEIECEPIDGITLKLVPVTEDHLALFAKMSSDPDISRYMGSAVRAYSMADEKEWYERVRADKAGYVWSIMLGEDHVGIAGIHRIDPITRSGETGMMIDKPYWGKGIATRIHVARATFAKDRLNLRALRTRVCVKNEASWKAAQHAGHVQTGVERDAFFVDGQFYDLIHGFLLLEK